MRVFSLPETDLSADVKTNQRRTYIEFSVGEWRKCYRQDQRADDGRNQRCAGAGGSGAVMLIPILALSLVDDEIQESDRRYEGE